MPDKAIQPTQKVARLNSGVNNETRCLARPVPDRAGWFRWPGWPHALMLCLCWIGNTADFSHGAWRMGSA